MSVRALLQRLKPKEKRPLNEQDLIDKMFDACSADRELLSLAAVGTNYVHDREIEITSLRNSARYVVRCAPPDPENGNKEWRYVLSRRVGGERIQLVHVSNGCTDREKAALVVRLKQALAGHI